MTALPAAATKTNLDQATDDASQARAELADHVDKFNTLRSYLTGLLGTDGTATTARSTLGLGAAALAAVGTSGDALGKLNTANTWSAIQLLANAIALQGKETGGTARNLAQVNGSNQVALGDSGAALLLAASDLAMAELVSVDAAADKLPILDADAGAFKWATPQNLGLGGNVAILETTNIASSTSEVDVEASIGSTFDAYMIVGAGLHVDGQSGIDMRLKVGGTYQTSASYNEAWIRMLSNATSPSYSDASGSTSIRMITAQSGSDSTASASFVLWFTDPTNTAIRKSIGFFGWGVDRNNIAWNQHGAGYWNGSNAALTGVRFFPDSGGANFDDGRITLYGFKHS